jgi:hypothetical protein
MAAGNRPDPRAPSRESAATRRLSVPNPESLGLPRSKRNYVVPIAIALAVFALIVLLRLVWG